MFECMQVNNKCDIFGIEKTNNNKYVIYRYDNNAMLKTNAVLYDEIFHWLDIEPFETLEKCYNFMVAYINDLMQLGGQTMAGTIALLVSISIIYFTL